MSANRPVRLRVFRTAVLLATVLSLLCLVVPNEAILPGIGRYVGAGKAVAADVTAVTVDNSTSGMAVIAPTQRKLFYASGQFWVFYTDGSELVYKSSSDGLSWSARSASLGALSVGGGVSVHFDGTYVHYARSTGTNDEPLYYRRGIPDADGTIAWSAGEQVAVPVVGGVRYLHPSISADSSGHALISYHYEKQNGLAGEGPRITKSGNTDGTWGTSPAGFPYELASASESEWYTTVHGLTADKIAVTFADHTNIKGVSVRTYDGAIWNSMQTTVSNPQFGSGYSAVAQGDDVHIALLTTSTFDILYCKYSYSTNTFGLEHMLLSSATSSSFPALARTANDDLYCFWAGAPATNHVYYTRMVSGVWDAGCTDWLAETDLKANGGVTTFYDQGSSDYVGLAWETGTASPYDIRFAAVGITSAPNQAPNQPGNVLPSDAASGQSLTPTLEASDFSDPDAGDTHGASQWQIRISSGDHSSPVFDSQTDTANLLDILVPSGKLSYSTTYCWHVRHQDNHGDWSDWSAEWSFTTVSAPLAGFSSDRTAVVVGQTVTFTNSSAGGVAPLTYQWDFNNDSIWDSTETNPSHIYGSAGIYTVVLKVTDDATNTATASKTDYITVNQPPNQPPNQPGNTLPVDAASGQSLTPTLGSSDFSDVDAGDTHGASQWQIRTSTGDYSSPVFDSQADTADLLSILVPVDRLGYSTTYYWHVRHQDNHGDWSDWSVETSFSTAAAPSTPPEEPDDEDTVPTAPSTPPEEPDDEDTVPAAHNTPLDEPFDGDAGPGLPDTASGGSGSLLPFLVAIVTGIAVVPIVGGTFYLVHARMLNKPKGLRSARTISRRLRK